MPFNLSTITAVHTALSIIAIAFGVIVLIALVRGRVLPGWTSWYLATSVATSVTGFFFPFVKLLPSHVVGVLSLIALAVAIQARHGAQLVGRWRASYAVSCMVSIYFLVFVAIAQAFTKVPALHALAPTLAEPPFAIANGVVLLAFAGLTVMAVLSLRRSGSGAVPA